ARSAPRTRPPASATTVLSGPSDAIATGAAQSFFASAPVVVLADPGRPAAVAAAAADAVRAHAPLLLTATAGQAIVGRALQEQIHALKPRAVLAVGVPGSDL